MNVIKDPYQYMMDEFILVVLYFDAKLIILRVWNMSNNEPDSLSHSKCGYCESLRNPVRACV